MFLGRIELGKAGALDVSFPVVTFYATFLLFNEVFQDPDFGPIILGSVADEDDFEKRLVRF